MVKDDILKANYAIENKKPPRYVNEFFLKLYSFSNENLSGYLRNYEYFNKKTLTVGSSADQILNLINYNCQDITLLDLNPFVKYYYELKKAAILGLDPKGYLNFFCNNNSNSIFRKTNPTFNPQVYLKIKKYMNQDSQMFWNSLFDKYSPRDIKKNLFMSEELPKKSIINNNDYINNDNFKSLRKKIDKVTPNFLVDEISHPKHELSKYDYIFISNVIDYIYNIPIKEKFEVEEIISSNCLYLISNLSDILNEEGHLFFQYIWECNDPQISRDILFDKVLSKYKDIENISIPNAINQDEKIDKVYIYKKILKR